MGKANAGPLIAKEWIPYVRTYLIQRHVKTEQRIFVEDVLWGKRPLDSLSWRAGKQVLSKLSGVGYKAGTAVATWGRNSTFDKFMQRYPKTNPYNPDSDTYQYTVFLLYAYKHGQIAYQYRFDSGTPDDGDRLYDGIVKDGLGG